MRVQYIWAEIYPHFAKCIQQSVHPADDGTSLFISYVRHTHCISFKKRVGYNVAQEPN